MSRVGGADFQTEGTHDRTMAPSVNDSDIPLQYQSNKKMKGHVQFGKVNQVIDYKKDDPRVSYEQELLELKKA